jgi:hypothetical protein
MFVYVVEEDRWKTPNGELARRVLRRAVHDEELVFGMSDEF